MTRLHADLILLLAAAVWALAFLFQKSAIGQFGPLAFVAARGPIAALARHPWPCAKRAGRGGPGARAGFLLRSPSRAANAVFRGGVAAAGRPAHSQGHRHRFPHRALRRDHAVLRLGVERQGRSTPTCGSRSGCLRWAPGCSAAGRTASFSTGDMLVALSACPGRRPWSSPARGARLPPAHRLHGGAVRRRRPCSRRSARRCSRTRRSDGLRGGGRGIAYVGLLSSALTFTLLTVALQYTPPSEVAVIVGVETLFAALAAYLLLGERLAFIGWVGAAMIMSATSGHPARGLAPEALKACA